MRGYIMYNEAIESLSIYGDKYLNYFLSLNEKNKYKFKCIYNFSSGTQTDIIDYITQSNKDNLLIFGVMFKSICTKYFSVQIKNKCTNIRCKKSENTFSTSRYLKKCPECKGNLEIENKEQLDNNIKYYLQSYSFYLLAEESESIYLIYDKHNKQYFIKKNNNNFKDFVYYILKGHNINISYLISIYGNKAESSILFDYLQDNDLICIIHNIGFRPVKDLFYIEDEKTYFNNYKGNKYLSLLLSDEEKKEAQQIDIKKECPDIYYLINNLVSGDKEGFNYIINYLSFVLNNPCTRTEKVISFYGEEETGKGIFYHFVLNVLFENYCSFISMKELENDEFNDHYLNKLFVFVDESYYKKSIESMMLTYTTAKIITINKKHGTKKPTSMYFNYICASNKEVPMKVGNRRSVYFRSRTLGGSLSQAKILGEELTKVIPSQINIFAKYLKSLDVDFKTINKGYDNSDKADINEATKTIQDRFIDELTSFRSISDFIKSTFNISTYNEVETLIHNNSKDGFIEYNLFLDLYNKFRSNNGILNKESLNKFNWFCNKLDIDKNNKEHFKRGYNNDNKNVRWVNIEIINKLYNKIE